MNWLGWLLGERGTWGDLLGRLAPKPAEVDDEECDWGKVYVVDPAEEEATGLNLGPPDEPETPLEALDAAMEARGLEVHDLRGLDRTKHYPPRGDDGWGWFRDDHPKKNIPIRAKPGRKRKASKVTCAILHTTAVRMGWRRFLGTPVQLGVDKDGHAVLLHHLLTRMPHAHHGNAFSFGIEISGESDITPEQAETVRLLLKYGRDEVWRLRELEGETIMRRIAIATHFNVTNKRGLGDPGRDIWRRCGNFAIDELGYKLFDPPIGKGQAVPEEWKA